MLVSGVAVWCLACGSHVRPASIAEMRRGRALTGPPRRPHRVLIESALLEALNRTDDEAFSTAVTGMLSRVDVECEVTAKAAV